MVRVAVASAWGLAAALTVLTVLISQDSESVYRQELFEVARDQQLALGYSFEHANENFVNDLDKKEGCEAGFYKGTKIRIIKKFSEPWNDPCLPWRIEQARQAKLKRLMRPTFDSRDHLWRESSIAEDNWPSAGWNELEGAPKGLTRIKNTNNKKAAAK